VPLKSKPLGNSGKRLHGTHEERKTVSAAQNGQSYSKTGSNKLTSANKPNFSSVDPRRQLDSNIRNGPGRPTGPKGLPLKKPVATMEKKITHLVCRNLSLQSCSHRYQSSAWNRKRD
jgi:protein SPT2